LVCEIFSVLESGAEGGFVREWAEWVDVCEEVVDEELESIMRAY
jgi:hypothetical protein